MVKGKVALIILVMLFLSTLATTGTIYFCPKCNSTDIEIVCIDPVPPDKMVSIDEPWALGPTITLAVMRYSHYRLTCKKCGYFVEKISPY